MQGKEKKRTKAVGLLSGGLDSTLAAKLVLGQGIEVYAVNFTSGCAAVVTAVKELGNIPLKQVALRDEYLEMVRKPKHGYGSGMNPCIDCRIMKIQKAGEYMREIDAAFLFTGEVLGQRPMSQHKHALELIDRESGMGGYTLRPLSAAQLEPTIPEVNGLVDRRKLLGISGRSRKKQISDTSRSQ
jgi:tRNA U34 2-thiouridine synthase MnmA/TrmU